MPKIFESDFSPSREHEKLPSVVAYTGAHVTQEDARPILEILPQTDVLLMEQAGWTTERLENYQRAARGEQYDPVHNSFEQAILKKLHENATFKEIMVQFFDIRSDNDTEHSILQRLHQAIEQVRRGSSWFFLGNLERAIEQTQQGVTTFSDGEKERETIMASRLETALSEAKKKGKQTLVVVGQEHAPILARTADMHTIGGNTQALSFFAEAVAHTKKTGSPVEKTLLYKLMIESHIHQIIGKKLNNPTTDEILTTARTTLNSKTAEALEALSNTLSTVADWEQQQVIETFLTQS